MFQSQPDATVVAVCDVDEGVLAQFEEAVGEGGLYADYEQFLDHDLDVVVVATPPMFHAEQSIAALDAGRHVMSEVPAVWSLDECQPLADAVRRSKARYMFAENCNYWAFIDTWTDMVRAGKIGKPMYGEAEYIHNCESLMHNADGSPTWRTALPPIHYCTHSLGPLLKVLDDRCVRCSGMSTGSNRLTDEGVIDMQVGLFTTARGTVLKILCGFTVVREPAFHFFSLYGTEGTLERERMGEDTLAYLPGEVSNLHGMLRVPVGISNPKAPIGAAAGGHGTAEHYMVRELLEALTEDREPSLDVYRGLDMTVPGLCAHLSSQNGGELTEIPDFRGN